MYILRTKTNDGIRTFEFETMQDMRDAAYYVKQTSADGFMAVLGSDPMHGKVIEQWAHHSSWGGQIHSNLSYSEKQRAYADGKSMTLGAEEECRRMAKETNDKVTCWADMYARVEHLVGSLWQTVFVCPFTD